MAEISRLPGPNADAWDWQLQARCRGMDSSVFFHPWAERGLKRTAREQRAKEICADCPVMAQCRSHALEVRESYGVWGGLTEDERFVLVHRPRVRRKSVPTAEVGADTDTNEVEIAVPVVRPA